MLIIISAEGVDIVNYTDKSGLFEDFNFKLVVIEALLDKSPSFKEKLDEMIEKYTKKFEWYTNAGPIEAMLEFFSQLHIDQNDLDKVTELCFDGGHEVYGYIKPDWDGEDDYFDIQSVKGFENLKNLKSVEVISMISEEALEPMKGHGIIIN